MKKSSGVWFYNLVSCKLMRSFSMGGQYYNSLCQPCGIVGQRGITEDRQSRSRWHSTSPDDTDMYKVQAYMAGTSTSADGRDKYNSRRAVPRPTFGRRYLYRWCTDRDGMKLYLWCGGWQRQWQCDRTAASKRIFDGFLGFDGRPLVFFV